MPQAQLRVQCPRSPPVLQFSCPPVFQSSSLPVFQIQFQLESESGDPFWRPILENPFLGGCRGVHCQPSHGFLPPRRSPRRLSSPILPRLGALVRHLGAKMPQHVPRYPKNTILEPISSNIALRTHPRQPRGRGGPNS